MTVTKHQAQMLATLACACRPLGASRWDSAGVMASIERIKERSLPEVVMAVIRAASDKQAETPGVIPKSGSHWQETVGVRPYQPNVVDASKRCSICSLSEPACRIRYGADHEFESDAMAARRVAELPPGALALAVAAVRDGIEPTLEAAARPTLDDLAVADPDLHARVDELRHLKQPMREPETPLTDEPTEETA